MSERPLPKPRLVVVDRDDPGARSDAALVLAGRAGDVSAQRDIWLRYAPLVGRFLRRALGPDADAEDLLQDVFLKVFERLDDVRDPEALRSFLFAVAMNAIRYELRRRRARRLLSFEWARPERTPRSEPAPSPARLAMRRVYEILDRLGASEREVFVLRHLEGWELTEIAAQVGLSLATVKRRLSAAGQRVFAQAERDPFLIDYLAALPGEAEG